jgi:hypothetical protein
VSGDIQKPKDMESIHGKTAIDMKVSGSNVWNTGKELTFLKTETPILVSIKMESQMEKVNTHGRMGHFMLESSSKVLSMERVVGRVPRGLNQVISMKVIILMIKSTAMECSLGQVVTHIKENIKKMKETVTVRWNGQMEVFIKVNGVEEFSMATAKCYFLTEL